MAYRDKHDPRYRASRMKHYRNNKAQYLARNAAKQRSIALFLNGIKSRPCADCGGVFHPFAMDFDHLPERGEKHNNLANLRRWGCMKKILAELEKCEVVCSNCHRVRTFYRLEKLRGTGSTGRASVSKTDIAEFESLVPCQLEL